MQKFEAFAIDSMNFYDADVFVPIVNNDGAGKILFGNRQKSVGYGKKGPLSKIVVLRKMPKTVFSKTK